MNENNLLDEKLKLKYDIIKIVIDKLLIGIIIVVTVLAGNIWLENYKNILTKDRIFYEKKYEVINKMVLSYKDLTNEISRMTMDTSAKYNISYFDKFQNHLTQASPYLSDSLSKELEKYLWLLSPNFGEIKILPQHAAYLEFIDDRFDCLIKKELDERYILKKDEYNLINMSYIECTKIGSREYFKRNFENWIEFNKKR